MAKIKIFLLSIFSLILIQCATPDPNQQPIVKTVIVREGQATNQLAQTAGSVNTSLKELARIQGLATPPLASSNLLDTSGSELQNPITVDWVGPIAPLVKKIAEANQYRVREIGKEPTIPVLVNISVENIATIEVLRDIDYQARPKAEIGIFDEPKVIEIRYADN